MLRDTRRQISEATWWGIERTIEIRVARQSAVGGCEGRGDTRQRQRQRRRIITQLEAVSRRIQRGKISKEWTVKPGQISRFAAGMNQGRRAAGKLRLVVMGC